MPTWTHKIQRNQQQKQRNKIDVWIKYEKPKPTTAIKKQKRKNNKTKMLVNPCDLCNVCMLSVYCVVCMECVSLNSRLALMHSFHIYTLIYDALTISIAWCKSTN